ncbi:STAS domain-containing protein [Ramlibacter tataouinensis]|uniref:Candidate signal transduction protein (Modulator protein rsbR), STAS domain protein n=1 Tax=Ramlibacter tataouinensis (strain ATCC BAA-407 / DSM 14655 / LMG 21543 / TTB310) TaxID=365046 RepID=F5XZV5_RAMTT|nr:STAS domain-containing protein [Ramlibacter tataouinensis]AEG93316.1 Candidate signal transduction protein (modulator protein rsbR), STAS domain protein [Ramlibacter tataouinensis TTB310]
MNQPSEVVLAVLRQHENQIRTEWLQASSSVRMTDAQRRAMEGEAAEILHGVRDALEAGADPEQFEAAPWSKLRQSLESLSRSRAAQGHSAADTSVFVLAFKRPMFTALQRATSDPQAMLQALWNLSVLVDRMAQWTVSTYQQTREEIIQRQQQDLLELSTPVIKLWEGVLAVPMIGTLDSGRTQMVMETLLQRIVETGATLAIIDITGVPTVDTLVAQHLLKTVSAIRLMGAECVISGIRPQIAQTIVHLGIDLQGIASKASLADALSLALRQRGYTITKAA